MLLFNSIASITFACLWTNNIVDMMRTLLFLSSVHCILWHNQSMVKSYFYHSFINYTGVPDYSNNRHLFEESFRLQKYDYSLKLCLEISQKSSATLCV